MSLKTATRRVMLKRYARRLFLEIRTIEQVRFRGPVHAMRIANQERKLARVMRDLAEIDPEAAKLVAESEGV